MLRNAVGVKQEINELSARSNRACGVHDRQLEPQFEKRSEFVLRGRKSGTVISVYHDSNLFSTLACSQSAARF